MNEDLWIFVCTHGKLGEELIHSAEMIAGKVDNVYSFSLLPCMSSEEYAKMLEEKMKEAPGEVLCLIDLFGGTPCNICASLSKKYHMHLLSGVNLSMYIELTSQKNNFSIENLLVMAMDTLKSSGKNVIEELNQRKKVKNDG